MISVIIATRDRARLLESTLEALCRQVSPGCPFEILVVDNGSVDGTPEVVAAAARRSCAPIVYVTEAKPGKSHALNTALVHARGDLLVFTDDDVLPSPGWLAAYAQALSETGADYASGRTLPLWEAPAPRWMTPALYGVLSIADGGPRRLTLAGHHDHVMPIGGNMAVTREAVERVGGWNSELGKLKNTLRTGEDHEFALRLVAAGFAGIYEPQASVLHRVPADRLRLPYLFRWFYGNGRIEAGLEADYPSAAYYLLNVPRYLWRQFAKELIATVSGCLTGNSGQATAGAMRVAWFAGYLTARWKLGGVRATIGARPRVISRSSRC